MRWLLPIVFPVLQDLSNAHSTTHSLSENVSDKTVVKLSGSANKTPCLAAASEVSHNECVVRF